jgi:hypothetical protein
VPLEREGPPLQMLCRAALLSLGRVVVVAEVGT